jgi:hypothetical protein
MCFANSHSGSRGFVVSIVGMSLFGAAPAPSQAKQTLSVGADLPQVAYSMPFTGSVATNVMSDPLLIRADQIRLPGGPLLASSGTKPPPKATPKTGGDK